jgi:long-chain acyl-CoA synthetase
MMTYAERPWTKHYAEGVPVSLEPYPDIGLHDLLRQVAGEHPERDILLTSIRLPIVGRQGSTVTLAELDRASDALGAALVDMGLKKGDRVAIILPTCTAFAITYYAILQAGGVVAACNPVYPPPKMAYQIDDCDAKFVITMRLFYKVVKELQAKTQLESVIVTNIKEYFPPLGKLLFTLAVEKKEGHYVEGLDAGDRWFQDLLKKYDGQKPNVKVSSKDLALFQYTGGTTGVSKGAMATHRALVANILQFKAWLESILKEGRLDTTLGALPMFHVYGMVLLLSFSVTVGTKIALVMNPRDTDELVDIIDTCKPISFSGVPAMFDAIANHPRVKSGQVSLKSIELCSSGSAPLPPAVQDAFEPLISGQVAEGFGMSEAPTVTHGQPVGGEYRRGSIGLPLPDMDCRIVSLLDGETDVPVGEVGELVMAGPIIMQGYHKMPTETANVLREKDGKVWLYTGDIGRMDEDGYFYIVDRKKDMVLIGGFNVYPANIEKVLYEHPAVLEVGVVGIPHPERVGQEAVKAWVVLKPAQSATSEDLIEHCSKYLAPYEVPRRYAFVDALPKSAVGKTLRRELVRLEMEAQRKEQVKAGDP